MKHLLLGLALACTAGLASAADDKASGGDQEFVLKASAGGLAEVNAGTMASKMASHADVKKFAMQMVEDHTKANKELMSLADKKRLKVAAKQDAKHDEMAKKLMTLSGAEFDREYVAGQVKDHEETVALFEKEAKGGSDKDLKAWAEKTLPDLKHHLMMAKELHGKLKK